MLSERPPGGATPTRGQGRLARACSSSRCVWGAGPSAVPGGGRHAVGVWAAVGNSPDTTARVLVALTAILVVGRALNAVFVRVGQPPVLGEVLAGILLGPSLLGWVWPDASALLLSPSAAPVLGVLANLGVILYMFRVGLELDPSALRRQWHAVAVISQASTLTPFLLGMWLALPLYPRYCPGGVPFLCFSLFMGIAMSITAFPVLARILCDHGMQRTPLGVIALGSAAVVDLIAWCGLAVAVGTARTEVRGTVLVFGLTAVYVAVMLGAVRPVLARVLPLCGARCPTAVTLSLLFAAVLASSLATNAIGVHAVFGAFLLGTIIPHDDAAARAFVAKLEEPLTVLFLPAFFAFAGMKTQVGLVSGPEQWLTCGLIIAVATAGKFGGAYLAARCCRMSRRDATVIGVLMNTRGLMELVVLDIGLELHVISPTLFSMMVLMAVATTAATAPVLHWLTPAAQPVPVPAVPGEADGN